MRELSIKDVEQVNGGDATEAVVIFGVAISVVALTGIGTLGVAAAFAASPIAAIAALGLSLAGGYSWPQQSNSPLGTVTVGNDYRESDC